MVENIHYIVPEVGEAVDPGAVVAETRTVDWLPCERVVTIGLTAGASTPDAIVGQVVERLETFAGESV